MRGQTGQFPKPAKKGGSLPIPRRRETCSCRPVQFRPRAIYHTSERGSRVDLPGVRRLPLLVPAGDLEKELQRSESELLPGMREEGELAVNKCPCHGCDRRTMTCHYQGVCPEWEAWKKEDQAKKEWLRGQKPQINEGAYKVMYRKLSQIKRGHMKRRVKDYD